MKKRKKRKTKKCFSVIVGGSRGAKERFPTKSFPSLSSAKRRVKAIRAKQDMGVSTIFLIPEEID